MIGQFHGATRRGGVSPGGGGGASTFTISGTVVDGSAAAVAGGTVQLLLSGTVIATVAPNGSGVYSFANLANATYTLKLHPPLAYSLGPSEPDTQSVVVAGANMTQGFVVQSALASDSFQSYTTNGQLQNTTVPIPAGDFWYGVTNGGLQATANVAQITLDATGGPSGDKAMLYSMPARPGLTTAYALYLGPRILPTPAGLTTIAVRWTDKYSSGFVNGEAGVSGSAREYKMMLLQCGPPQGQNGVPQIGVYLEQSSDAGVMSVTMDVTDRIGNNINTTHATSYALPSNWRNAYHSWAVVCAGLGSSGATFELWYDGTLIISLSGSFLPAAGSLDGTSTLIFPAWGEQINNGPTAAQSRWWREIGVYKTRPNLLAGVAA